MRAIQDSLAGFLSLFIRLALPLAILLGLALIALTVGNFLRKDSAEDAMPLLKCGLQRMAGFALVGLTFTVCWAALSQTRGITVEALRWKDAAEAVSNPTEDAPPVFQSGPIAAEIKEGTFTKTIALPTNIAQQMESQGVQAISQYIPETMATNVLDQSEKLEKKGNGYFYTRTIKRLEENPVPFQKTKVEAQFKGIGGRAYDLQFKGSYAFRNPAQAPAKIRFSFPLPQTGTVQNLKVLVGTTEISQPAPRGNYEWSGELLPGESREAIVSYSLVGARNWNYDVGSQRRPVEDFSLSVSSTGPLKHMRGSLQPSQGGNNPNWILKNVVTNQQVSISFPSDAVGRETFIQTMAMLPAALAAFIVGIWLVVWRLKLKVEPGQLAVAIGIFAFGLGGAVILANYLGTYLGVVTSLVIGLLGVSAVMGARSLLASVPAALFAAAFLSPEHTGLIIGITALASLACITLSSKFGPVQPA